MCHPSPLPPLSVLVVVKAPPKPPKLSVTKPKAEAADVAGELLLTWRDWQAYRFILEVEVSAEEQQIVYQVRRSRT